VLASEPPTVASAPIQLNISPWLKPLLTSLLPIVGDWWGTMSRSFRTEHSR